MKDSERIDMAINTATNICNMSDDKNVLEMAQHIADTLAPLLPEKTTDSVNMGDLIASICRGTSR